MLLLAFFATGLTAKRWDPIKVSRKMNPILSVRTPNEVKLFIENLTTENLRVKVRDEPPQDSVATKHEFEMTLRGERDEEVSYQITPQYRGEDGFRGTFGPLLSTFRAGLGSKETGK